MKILLAAILAAGLGLAALADETAVPVRPVDAVVEQAPAVDAPDAITIPRLLSYQGKLTDTLDIPVPDGQYSVVFRLYSQPSGGSSFWNETQNVTTKDGLFSVLLGSVTPVGSMPDAGAAYLGMAVAGGAELTPRLRIVSAAYAFKADTANYALSSSAVADNAWTRSDSVLFTVNQLGIARGGASNVLYGSNAARSTHVNLGVACTTGQSGQNHEYATVGGGWGNTASGSYATVGGGDRNTASGLHATVAGGEVNIASGSRATVGGGDRNTASNSSATVGGGRYNTASGWRATVGGGVDNIASGDWSTVGGGWGNTASGSYATVGGGIYNTASGSSSVIPGGYVCTTGTAASMSFAAGNRAVAEHRGCFVWGDSSTPARVVSSAANQWTVRSAGGVRFYSNSGLTSGVLLAAGGNSWASVCDSTNKTDFRPVDRQKLLEKLAAMPVHDYRMKDQTDGTRHIGPVAQDFAAFGFGENDVTINNMDAIGVSLAAIQALYEDNRALRAELEALKAALERGR